MSFSSGSFLQDQASPLLSARLSELVQYLSAPLIGRLTDEQRALSLSIARRLVAAISTQIDPEIDCEHLWGDWLQAGIPANLDLAAACFIRAEEYRWISNVNALNPPKLGDQQPKRIIPPQFDASAPFADEPELSETYLQLQIADRRRFNSFGYPTVSIADLPDDLYRHLLNEVAGWRLGQISKDRILAEKLGKSVRKAWKSRDEEEKISAAAKALHDQLQSHGRLEEEANLFIDRQDWAAFIAIFSAANEWEYAQGAAMLFSHPMSEMAIYFAPLGLKADRLLALEQSLSNIIANPASSDSPL